jgi:hypothetical protein
MTEFHRLTKLAYLAVVPVMLGCPGDNATGTDDDDDDDGALVTCAAAETVCPPASSTLGFSGPTGSPTIAPTNSQTTVSATSSSHVASGTTNATSNGNWLIVIDNTLRASGVLPVANGFFSTEVPLFCGAQQLVYTFTTGGNRSYFRTAVTQSNCVNAQFRVQLSWDTGPDSDIDLHLLRPNGLMQSNNDCYYSNCQGGTGLEWGAAGTAGNPVLDVDDTQGYGPENIIIGTGAESGEYRVVVHNFDGSTATRATIKIYINEVEVQRFTSLTLDTGRDYWQVARVNVLTGAVTSVNTYSAAPPTRIVGDVKKSK